MSVSGMKNLINGLLKIFKKPTSTPIESISPPNPTPTLYCLFNRNDPTPTARALRNLNWHNAKILIVGHSNFQRKHKENIERLEVWATGVPKPKQWPDRLWRKDWNWTPLQYENIDFIKLQFTSEALDGIRDGDIVDLTGGTKAQCGELVQAIHQKKCHVTLVLQTQSCQTLNLSTGELRENMQEPSLRERVWLSGGYIVNLSESTRGSAESGLIWSRSPTIIDGKAIVPEDPLELSRALNLDYGMNIKGGKWLEQASAHLISTWPNISESHSELRMIKPSFRNAAGAAWHVISQPHAEPEIKEMFEEILEKTEEMSFQEKRKAWHEYLSSENLTDEIIHCVNKGMHSVECDFLAFDKKTGTVYIGECKRTKIKDRDRGRIFSIQKKLFPTNGVPLMVHARDESYSLDDIPIISWPELSDPEVIQKTKMNPKEVKKNPETVAKKKRNTDFTPEQIEIIKRTLFLLKEDPREFNPGFIDALRSQDFGETRGILAWIEKNLQKEMGFTIDKDPPQKLSSEEWLRWDLVD